MDVKLPVELKMGKATRDAFGEALRELGKTDTRICVVDGDVNNSTRTEWFGKAYPDRFFNLGIAESNMVGVAAGLAACGKVPFVASFAVFLWANAFDQLRMSVAFPRMNVKMVGSHAGISIGEDGPSQMAIEDVGLALSLPGVAVVVPADEPATREAVRTMVEYDGPIYLRCGRPAVPLIYPSGCPFELGKAIQLRAGDDVAILANGLMVAEALGAAETLAAGGIQARVLDVHTARPLDEAAIVAAARQTRGVVVAEEHLVATGLGVQVAQLLAEKAPASMRFVGVQNTYAESGPPKALLQKYGLTADAIVQAARSLL
ncbi:MAG TPA: transketolase C-terminal domain-containing protein [Chloroflexota bacterium]|jgi:transketolase|nr:transketolase C-terminal domain-containing protein [Chloroflexota bacterium]